MSVYPELQPNISLVVSAQGKSLNHMDNRLLHRDPENNYINRSLSELEMSLIHTQMFCAVCDVAEVDYCIVTFIVSLVQITIITIIMCLMNSILK